MFIALLRCSEVAESWGRIFRVRVDCDGGIDGEEAFDFGADEGDDIVAGGVRRGWR